MILRLFLLLLILILERVGFPFLISSAWILSHVSSTIQVDNKVFLFVFVSGLMSDLIYLHRLGSFSFVLLFISALIFAAQSYIPQTKRLWLVFGVILTEVSRQLLYYGEIHFLQVCFSIIIALIISSLFITQHSLSSGVSLRQWMK